MSGFWITMIVLIVFAFVLAVIKLGLKHAENIERIRHGYPLADGTGKQDLPEYDEAPVSRKERFQ